MRLKKQKKLFVKFLKVFQKNKTLKINFILLCLFFLTFPNQNAYQHLQPAGSRPLVRAVDFKTSNKIVVPVNKTGVVVPPLSAKSVIVVDLPSKTVLYSKNPDWQLLPASTTKIMTALVALDYFQPDDILTVKNKWNIGQIIGLYPDEKLTFQNLLYGLLVASGNDAAQVIAENYPGGIEAYVVKMNEKAVELNLTNTHYANTSGIDQDNHLTTTRDLALLAAEALKNPLFSQAVATKETEIQDTSGYKKHYLKSTNQLVGLVSGIKGVKTGWTESAGECLVAYTDRPEGQIITVVLGSQDRFGETSRLVEWVYDNFQWQEISD